MRSLPILLCFLLAAAPAFAWRSDHPPGGGYGMHGYGMPPFAFGVVPPVIVVPAPPVAQMGPTVQSAPRYLCDNPKGQYPQVRTCHHPWRTAPAHTDMRQAR